MSNFKLYWKHFFDTYKIYKVGDKFIVKINFLIGFIPWHNEWVYSGNYMDVGGYNCFMSIYDHCKLDSCQDAYLLIDERKKYLKEVSEKTKLNKIKKKKNRIKFASECYK